MGLKDRLRPEYGMSAETADDKERGDREPDDRPDGVSFEVESLWRACERIPGSAAADLLVGRSFGGVKLTRFIAEGGMGRVYEAQQLNPARPVAVKVLRPGFFTQETLRRFVREVSTLGSLRHPWITQVYSAGTYEYAGAELPYFVMELIADALPITAYAKTRCLSVADRLALFRQVCDAIAYGHERGIVHRDIKPSNVLIDGLGHPKVIDFGVAQISNVRDRGTTLTEPGQMVGTLQYMSPEQVSGRPGQVDARADVYSLGAVLYELLAGRPAYDLSGRSLFEAAKIVQEQRPNSLRAVNPAVPRSVAAIVQRCLSKDRGSRFQTAAELSATIGDGRSELFSLIADVRRDAVGYCRVSAAGIMASGLILCGIYIAPPNSWNGLVQPSLSGPSRASSVAAGVAGAIRPPNAEVGADPAAALMLQPAEIHRDATTFRFVLRDVNQKGADAFLVKNVGMKKWIDQFMFPRVSYWAPAANNEEGTLVYRFDLGGCAESIHLKAVLDCWDFFREAGGVGRGASAIEISREGEDWVVIEDNIEPRRWGASIAVAKDLPEKFLNSETLWVRVRCITESAPVENGYNVAQFARTRPDRKSAAFEVTARLRGIESDSTSN